MCGFSKFGEKRLDLGQASNDDAALWNAVGEMRYSNGTDMQVLSCTKLCPRKPGKCPYLPSSCSNARRQIFN